MSPQHTLDQPKTMIASKGYVILNEPGAQSKPTVAELEAFVSDITKIPKNGNLLGHTSRENLVSYGRDGGDTTVLGSWEQEQLDEIAGTKAVKYIDAKALQCDNFVLNLYYGGGDASQPGEFAVPTNPVPVKTSLTVVYISRGQVSAQFYENTSATGPEEITHATDNYSEIPLRFTVLDPLTQGGSRLVHIGRQFGAPVATPPNGGGGNTPAVPGVTSTSPSEGSAWSGDNLTFAGTNLDAVTTVTFHPQNVGGNPAQANIVSKTASQLVVQIPVGATADYYAIKIAYGSGSDELTVNYRVGGVADYAQIFDVTPQIVSKGGQVFVEGGNFSKVTEWLISDTVVPGTVTGNTATLDVPEDLPGNQSLQITPKMGTRNGLGGAFVLSAYVLQLSQSSVSKAANPTLNMTVASLNGLKLQAVPVAPTTGPVITLPHSEGGTNPPTATIDYSAVPVGTYWVAQVYDQNATPDVLQYKTAGRMNMSDTRYALTVTA